MAASDRKPCIIFRPAPGWGFWSNFTCVLQGLDHADREGQLPVIDMERHRTRYSEDEDGEVLGTRNAWEYFFEQPSGMSVTTALALGADEYEGDGSGPFMIIDFTEANVGAVRRRGRELVGKYIRVKPDVLDKVNEIIPPGVHPDILGVHVRGTDMRRGFHSSHPIPAPPQTYLEEAVALDRQNGFTRIFLASDEAETIELFRMHFGNRLITTTAHRTPAGQDLGDGYDWLFRSSRPLHKYRLGLEVLLDALLLARCGHLLCGCSNLSQAAMYFSDAGQVVRFVPPIWRVPPCEKEHSVGRAFVASFAPLAAGLSREALTQHLEEMRLILEAVENARAEALRMAEQDSRERMSALQAQLTEAEKNGKRMAAEVALLKKQIAADGRKGDDLSLKHSRLEGRVRFLMDWWTWLGWRLRPWKKPSWRHTPFR